MVTLCLSISDIIQISIGSITAIALFITGLSYFLSRHTYKKQYEYNKKMKSLEIADEMAVFISRDISKVLKPFSDPDLKSFLNDYFSADDSLSFDYHSLESRCKKPPLTRFSSAEEFHTEYLKLIFNYFRKERIAAGDSAVEVDKNALKDVKEHNILFTLTLNKIEGKSMYFCTEIADEEIVYPSIHQVFLKLIKISSIRISVINKTTYDEYFKYTIELYRLWNKRQIEYNETADSEKIIHNQRMIEKNKFKN